jgi:hypothetical protein
MPGTSRPKPGSNAAFKAAEKELQKLLKSRKITVDQFNKRRDKIAKEFGAWPMGRTR